MRHDLLVLALAALSGCASPSAVDRSAFFASGADYEPPPSDKAQIIFFVPDDRPLAPSANALFETDGASPTLICVLAAHTGSLQEVPAGHHVFMTYGRSAHLMEADVRAGVRYMVAMRRLPDDDLQPTPVRATEHDAVTTWVLNFDLVGKTPLADEWFARAKTQVIAAQATALSTWRVQSDAERAALTLNGEDADP